MTKEPLATAKYLHPLENGGCHRWNWADGSDGVRHRHRRRKAPSFPGSGFLISAKPAENLQVVFISIFRPRRKLPALHDSTVTLLLTLSSTCFVPVLLTRYIGDDEAIYHLKRGRQHEPTMAGSHSHAQKGGKWGNNKWIGGWGIIYFRKAQ